jgi:hypothetical protein
MGRSRAAPHPAFRRANFEGSGRAAGDEGRDAQMTVEAGGSRSP